MREDGLHSQRLSGSLCAGILCCERLVSKAKSGKGKRKQKCITRQRKLLRERGPAVSFAGLDQKMAELPRKV